MAVGDDGVCDVCCRVVPSEKIESIFIGDDQLPVCPCCVGITGDYLEEDDGLCSCSTEGPRRRCMN